MIVDRINIPKLMLDNDAAYINHIEFLISSVDEDAELTIIKRLDSIGFRIKPSNNQIKPFIIKNIRKSHYKLGLKIDFSKSINSENNIYFWTCFNN